MSSASTSPAPRPEIELRVYLPIPSLGRQFAAYLGSPLRARGYPPMEGDHALIVEVAPGLAIERIIDLALKSVPDVRAGHPLRRAPVRRARGARARPGGGRPRRAGDPGGHRPAAGGRAAPARALQPR